MTDDSASRPMNLGDRVPVPDPTLLTTIAVDRAIADFKSLMDSRLRELDKAVLLAASNLDKQRADLHAELNLRLDQVTIDRLAQKDLIESKISGIERVTSERFRGVDSRFEERDTRTEQSAQESRISLDAALAAAKEAVSEQNAANAKAIAKSEEATQKQIDALVVLTQTSNRALDEKINDLKGRIDRGEGASTGYAALYTGLLGAGGFLISLGALGYLVTH